MPNYQTYSAAEFYQDWRYAVGKEFTTQDGQPFPYAENGHLHWDDELKKLEFGGQGPWDACGIAFAPNDSNILVSTTPRDFGPVGAHTEPVITVWDIKEYQKRHIAIQRQASVDEVVAPAAQTAASKAAEKGVKQTIQGQTRMVKESQVFSPSGKKFVYIPGGWLRSNDVDVWDINIVSTSDFQSDRIALHAYTDRITWMGWNHDESLFASVSWDKTIRIWDANTGDQRFCFTTTMQNWAGRFSPDSNYFVATCGTGATHIYNLSDGSTVWILERETPRGWRRALDWHPNGKLLAVGGEKMAPVYLLDVEKKEVLQQRTLSPEKTHAQGGRDTESVRSMLESCLGVRQVRFVDNGNKLAVWTFGDDSIEVYDLARELKWRFARGGTDDSVDNTNWTELKCPYNSKMVTWEDKERGYTMFASKDCDGIRIWSLPLTRP